MKLIFILLTIIILTKTQNPIPVSGLNLDDFSGKWYVVIVYGLGLTSEIKCFLIDSIVSGDKIVFDETLIYYNGTVTSQTVDFTTVDNSASTWTTNGIDVDWISYDAASGLATMAFVDHQFAVIYSRTPTITYTVLLSQLYLLAKEGYLVNITTNVLGFPNVNCTTHN